MDGLNRDPVVRDKSLEIDQGSIGTIGGPELNVVASGEEPLDLVIQGPLTSAGRQIVPDSDPHGVPLGRTDVAEVSHTSAKSQAAPQVLQVPR